jgi:Holliday junction resolvase RusA-like endonuclease
MSDKAFYFRAFGLPKAQPRVKACRRGNHAGVYTPKVADDWKSIIRGAADKSWAGVQLDGPVAVKLLFYLPRPKAHHRANGELKADAPVWHPSKPDLDNLEKAVLDALTNLGIWRDDGQVCSVEKQKVYVGASQRPGLACYVRECSALDRGAELVWAKF